MIDVESPINHIGFGGAIGSAVFSQSPHSIAASAATAVVGVACTIDCVLSLLVIYRHLGMLLKMTIGMMKDLFFFPIILLDFKRKYIPHAAIDTNRADRSKQEAAEAKGLERCKLAVSHFYAAKEVSRRGLQYTAIAGRLEYNFSFRRCMHTNNMSLDAIEALVKEMKSIGIRLTAEPKDIIDPPPYTP